MTERKILYLPPAHLSQDILSPEAASILENLGTVIWNELDRNYTSDELLEMLPGAAVVITAWGSPPITEEHVAAADALQIVGHAAGSVKTRLAPAGHERGIVLLSAADVIAESVAEYTLWAMLSGQRNLFPYEEIMKVERGWKPAHNWPGHSLYAKKVGLVSASMVGRRVINLLKPFGCDVMVYDPYLSQEDASLLDVRPVALAELFAEADIISVHAPITPETRRMITTRAFPSRFGTARSSYTPPAPGCWSRMPCLPNCRRTASTPTSMSSSRNPARRPPHPRSRQCLPVPPCFGPHSRESNAPGRRDRPRRPALLQQRTAAACRPVREIENHGLMQILLVSGLGHCSQPAREMGKCRCLNMPEW